MARVSFDSNVELFSELKKILWNVIFRARKNTIFRLFTFFKQINISGDILASKTGVIPTDSNKVTYVKAYSCYIINFAKMSAFNDFVPKLTFASSKREF